MVCKLESTKARNKAEMYFHYLVWLWFALSHSDSKIYQACKKICFCKEGTTFVNCSGVHALVSNLTFPHDAEHLDLSQNNLHSIPWKSLSSLWKLQILLLSSNSIHKVGERTFISLGRLHKLDIGRNDISFLGKSFSVGLTSLHELILAYNKLQELQYKSFQYFENLQKLNLQNNNISSIEMGTFRSLTRLRQLYLQNNCLHALHNRLFSMLQHLEILNLEGNMIKTIAPGAFIPLSHLTILNLIHNKIEHIKFKTLLSLQTPGTHILLSDNPWFCDCDLQRVFAKLHSVRRLILDDYFNMTCMEPHLLRNLPLSSVDTELCTAETVTVLVITFTVFVTVVAAIVMAERNRKKRAEKRWNEDSDVSYNAQN
ncbi:slit homolog 3 protein-like isoform X1 [Ahaetulla prasina]|uniref:slit homolog 3 protein-like isoform X1 n=2 Tax=Ahaetulla prasina TaxID=499056 RepID=UPI002647F2F2|nr:slit homolog 3 protein-like isoform X1 [Ahaetulla prasina]